MRKLQNLIVINLLIILNITLLYAVPKDEEKKIIIKIKVDSELSECILNSHNNCLDYYSNMLGEYKVSRLLSSSILKAIELKENDKYRKIPFYYSLSENLSRLYIIEYSNNIPPELLSKKLSSIPDLEYAEPMPERNLSFMPNDLRVPKQWYLYKVNSFDAWDFITTSDSVIAAIVDTGVDYLHPDLVDNIFINQGESGIDDFGNDKRTNKIDDDNNGYIDDWHGWDFVSSDSLGFDNDPFPGHEHGTHVAGTIGAIINNSIGIAGVARNVKLLPVKVGYDMSLSTSVKNTYEGVLYAAVMGADLINCSWGGSSKSESEQETIDAAVALGSAIVAAAGNDNMNESFYPAAYKGVMSVAAVDSSDVKAYFSNYDRTVDVSSPGVDILATVPDSTYSYMDGTSMATPVAVGVASLVKLMNPNYTPLQVLEHTKATSKDIGSINTQYYHQLGRGRVDALSAVSSTNVRSVIIDNYQISDSNNDGLFDIGDTVEINCEYLNILSPVKKVNVNAYSISFYKPQFLNNESAIGDMETGESKPASEKISFIVPENIPMDYIMDIEFMIADEDGYVGSQIIPIVFRPSYRTMDSNNIAVTFNSIGNIGYNDYSSNEQGIGFTYKNSESLLFEGSLMIGVASDNVSNVARGAFQQFKDLYFESADIFKLEKNKGIAALEGTAKFSDLNGLYGTGFEIQQKVYQFSDENKRDFIICVYDLINHSEFDYDSLFVGLFFDWDIGPSGAYNRADFDENGFFGYMKNNKIDTLPWVGIKLLSYQYLNYYAIDNDGTTEDNIGIYDGFTIEEKWKCLSSGITRRKSSITDASNVISAGPIKSNIGDTTRVAFSIFAGYNLEELEKISKISYQTAAQYNLSDLASIKANIFNCIKSIYPNPLYGNKVNIDFSITETTYLNLEVYDLNGKYISSLINHNEYLPGLYHIIYDTSTLSQGLYYIKLNTGNGSCYQSFTVVR